ncbi:MAG TPA: hypothetical protein VN694_08400 [Caulobacteraceae bacterium]|nr:hypothetical protein [Caulobacteraceae bacterium]
MADDGFRVELSAELGAKLEAAARSAGLSPNAYANELISQVLGGGDWREAKEALAHYDRTGEFVDADQALSAARARLMARLDASR